MLFLTFLACTGSVSTEQPALRLPVADTDTEAYVDTALADTDTYVDTGAADTDTYVDDTGCDDCDCDGDGWPSVECGGDDCDDNDPRSYPNPLATCGDLDCDGVVDTFDQDGDGWVDEDCEDYAGALPVGDCDDFDGGVHPEAPEVADGADNDCDGRVD